MTTPEQDAMDALYESLPKLECKRLCQPARGPIEKMIDQATGRQEVFVRALVDWANRTHWGAWEGEENDG